MAVIPMSYMSGGEQLFTGICAALVLRQGGTLTVNASEIAEALFNYALYVETVSKPEVGMCIKLVSPERARELIEKDKGDEGIALQGV